MHRDELLVIDDDPDFRELVSLFAEELGVTCVPASTPDEGTTLAEREAPRLRAVLLDYFMPGNDPARTAAAIKRRVGPDVPVVLVSAAVDVAELAALADLDRYLAKPFDLESLREILTPRTRKGGTAGAPPSRGVTKR